MESWNYDQEEKGYLFSDEMDFSLDAFMRSRKALVEFDNKASCNYERDGFTSDGEVVLEFFGKEGQQSMEFVDLEFPDLFRKSFNGGQTLETSSCDLDSNSSQRGNSSTDIIALDLSLGEEESESKHLSSLVESKTLDSSQIDLKLGRLADCQGARLQAMIKLQKKGLLYHLYIQPHSQRELAPQARLFKFLYVKFTVVTWILAPQKITTIGIKFVMFTVRQLKLLLMALTRGFVSSAAGSLLAEFDNGKRSCRRRLAGHNERRRKPQFDYMSGKQDKIHQSFQGTEYLGSSLQKRSQFPFQDIFRSGILFPGKYDQISHSGHVKLEHESIYSSQEAAAIKHGQELSGCALSLLSAQSRNPSRDSARNLLPSSLIFQGICFHNRDDQVSETPAGINSVDKYVPTESFPCGMNSKEDIKNGSSIHSNDNCQPSDLCDVKYHLSYEHGTVDLFQLSTNLQRVEQQRNVLMECENHDCRFPTV